MENMEKIIGAVSIAAIIAVVLLFNVWFCKKRRTKVDGLIVAASWVVALAGMVALYLRFF